MTREDRLAELFNRYQEKIESGTEEQALSVRKQIQAEVERKDRK